MKLLTAAEVITEIDKAIEILNENKQYVQLLLDHRESTAINLYIAQLNLAVTTINIYSNLAKLNYRV